jgi:hypothetical protein
MAIYVYIFGIRLPRRSWVFAKTMFKVSFVIRYYGVLTGKETLFAVNTAGF